MAVRELLNPAAYPGWGVAGFTEVDAPESEWVSDGWQWYDWCPSVQRAAISCSAPTKQFPADEVGLRDNNAFWAVVGAQFECSPESVGKYADVAEQLALNAVPVALTRELTEGSSTAVNFNSCGTAASSATDPVSPAQGVSTLLKWWASNRIPFSPFLYIPAHLFPSFQQMASTGVAVPTVAGVPVAVMYGSSASRIWIGGAVEWAKGSVKTEVFREHRTNYSLLRAEIPLIFRFSCCSVAYVDVGVC